MCACDCHNYCEVTLVTRVITHNLGSLSLIYSGCSYIQVATCKEHVNAEIMHFCAKKYILKILMCPGTQDFWQSQSDPAILKTMKEKERGQNITAAWPCHSCHMRFG